MKQPVPIVLLVYATSIDENQNQNFLKNVLKEAQELYSAFSGIEDDFDIIQHPYSTADALIATLRKHLDRIVILHFAGHTSGELWALDDGLVSSEGLAGILSLQSSIKLLFLNGCSNITQAKAFQNVGIPAVIATRSDIDDSLAENFSKNFYSHLVSSLTINASFKAAESATLMVPEDAKTYRSLDLSNQDSQPWVLTLNSPINGEWELFDALNDDSIGLPDYPKSILPPKKPFKHIAYYGRADAPIFFGRNDEIKRIISSLKLSLQPVLLIYGQTGVGKSSLLAAGLVPRLPLFNVFYLRYVSGYSLVAELEGMLNVSGSSVTWQEFEEAEKKPLIVIVDQLEEAFSTEDDKSQQSVINLLNFVALASSANEGIKGKLVLSFRKEWLAEVEALCQTRDLAYTSHFIEHLSRNNIIECIEGISKSDKLINTYQLSIPDEKLAGIIADDLLADKLSNRAPVLQILLSSMWDRVVNDEKREFTIALYESVSKDGVLLSDYFDRSLIEIGSINQLKEFSSKGLLLDILFFHTTLFNSTKNISKESLSKHYSHIGPSLALAVKALVDKYLLTEPHDTKRYTDHQSTRLSHDTFAPIIRARVEQSDASGIRARRILNGFKSQWLLKDVNQRIVLDREGKPQLKNNYPVISPVELSLINEGRSGTSILGPVDQYILANAEKENRRTELGKNSLLLLLVITSMAVAWSYLSGLI